MTMEPLDNIITDKEQLINYFRAGSKPSFLKIGSGKPESFIKFLILPIPEPTCSTSCMRAKRLL